MSVGGRHPIPYQSLSLNETGDSVPSKRHLNGRRLCALVVLTTSAAMVIIFTRNMRKEAPPSPSSPSPPSTLLSLITPPTQPPDPIQPPDPTQPPSPTLHSPPPLSVFLPENFPPPQWPAHSITPPPPHGLPVRPGSMIPLINASLSSVYPTHPESGKNYNPVNCIDMDVIDWDSDHFCLSEIGTSDPWISVQLQLNSAVGDVVIYLRDNECCGVELLSPFEVWVSDGPGDPRQRRGEKCAAFRCETGTANTNRYTSMSSRNRTFYAANQFIDRRLSETQLQADPWAHSPITVACNGLVGEYVTLRLPGMLRTLNIAQLRVFSPEEQSPSSPAAHLAPLGLAARRAALKDGRLTRSPSLAAGFQVSLSGVQLTATGLN